MTSWDWITCTPTDRCRNARRKRDRQTVGGVRWHFRTIAANPTKEDKLSPRLSKINQPKRSCVQS